MSIVYTSPKIFDYRDIMFTIKSFLNNNDIVELLLTSKNVSKILGKKNIFTSITIDITSDICNMIRHYLNNKASILKTVIIDTRNVVEIWPFSSDLMIFVNCGVNEASLNKKYESNKIIVVNKKYKYPYQHFWP